VSDFERALATGVVTTREEFDRLGECAHQTGASVDEVLLAIGRTSALTLDNLGLHIQGPTMPEPPPDAGVLRRLGRMYGERPGRVDGAAWRTAVAMERRRQGWTREAAYAEWRGQLVARVTAEVER
jgi:hypothetical protein